MAPRRSVLRVSMIAGVLTVLAVLLATRPAGAVAPAPDRATQRFEIRFMEMTIDHHLLGVAMAQLCIQNTTPPPPPSDADLVALCQRIAAAQSAEVQTLRSWLAQWYGVQYEGRIAQPGTLQRLERLSGEEFDIMISEMFIEHHARQIQNSLDCLQRAFHLQLLQLCQQQIATQSEEIVEFRVILMDHGIDVP